MNRNIPKKWKIAALKRAYDKIYYRTGEPFICLALHLPPSHPVYRNREEWEAVWYLQEHIRCALNGSATVAGWLQREGYLRDEWAAAGLDPMNPAHDDKRHALLVKWCRVYRLRWIEHMIQQVKNGEL